MREVLIFAIQEPGVHTLRKQCYYSVGKRIQGPFHYCFSKSFYQHKTESNLNFKPLLLVADQPLKPGCRVVCIWPVCAFQKAASVSANAGSQIIKLKNKGLFGRQWSIGASLTLSWYGACMFRERRNRKGLENIEELEKLCSHMVLIDLFPFLWFVDCA